MGKSIRVLLLEDSSGDSELILHSLRRAGYDPDWIRVETADGFLAELQADLDVILADYSLPQYDVIQALDAVKAHNVDVPVIVVTGQFDETRVVEAMRHGASDFLVKDRLSRLGPAIDHALQYKYLQKQKDQTQQSLDELSAIMQTVDELAPDGILVADQDGMIRHANPRAEELFGYFHGELLGKPVEVLLPEEMRPTHIALRMRQDPEAVVRRMLELKELTGVRKDGTRIPIDFRINPRLPKSSASVIILHDASERKQTEAQIRLQSRLLNQVTDAIYSTDLVGSITSWNHGAEIMYGWTSDQAIGKNAAEIIPCIVEGRQEQLYTQVRQDRRWSGTLDRGCSNSSVVHVLTSISLLTDEYGESLGYIWVEHDMFHQWKILQLNTRYQILSDQARDVIVFSRLSDGRILEVNQSAITTYGYSREELLSMSALELRPPSNRHQIRTLMEEANRGGILYQTVHQRKNGSVFPVEISAYGADLEGERVVVFMIRDITERKVAEESLRVADDQMNAILQSAPVAIVTFDKDRKITTWTHAAENMFGWKSEELLGKPSPLTPYDQTSEETLRVLRTKTEKNISVPEIRLTRKDGLPVDVSLNTASIRDAQDAVMGTLIILEDITELKRTADALQKSNQQLSTLIDETPLAIVALDTDGRIETWNPRAEEFFERTAEEAVGRLFSDLLPVDKARFQASFQKVISEPDTFVIELTRKKKDGTLLDLSLHTAKLHDASHKITGALGIYEDITDRRQREREQEAIARVASALRTADRPAEMFPVILEQVESLLCVSTTTIALFVPNVGKLRIEIAHGDWLEFTGQQVDLAPDWVRHDLGEGKTFYLPDTDAPWIIKKLTSSPVQWVMAVPLIAGAEMIGVLVVGKDTSPRDRDFALLKAISDISANAIRRAALYDQTVLAYQRLSILRTIDQAISASMDLRLVLDLLINQITLQLRMDIAMIYLYSPAIQTLEFAGGRGYPPADFVRRSFRLGESHIGNIALKREMEYIPDLSQIDDDFSRRVNSFNDHIVTFIGIPLIAKGQIKGVLEIFHRNRIEPDMDWLDFLHALGAQTAIAIDNAEMFGQLQRSNTNLTLAYDATIEGWSRALDLRDEQTEDHSQRVTDLTLKLASYFGVPLSEQIHIRRGSLLHDIGKVGVPDTILNKPGPLTEDEWAVMRQHPDYAVKLLSPISYLQPAMVIPAFHHEKWDGTGYPHRLKGEEIPFAARIFAVVDVWDALTSDRCYRFAWQQEKALEYIRAQSGAHFDPRIVAAFLEIIEQEQE